MKRMVGIFALLIVTTMLFGGFASAAPNFTASDPQDVTDPDFDIIEGGVYPSGDYIVFWMQVRGQINLYSADNTQISYWIDVYYNNDEHEIKLEVTVYNYEGEYVRVAAMYLDNGQSTLTEGKDYVISGNKLSFYVDKNIQNIGSIENSDITSIYFETVKVKTAYDSVSDEMIWEPGSSSGGSTGTTEAPSWIWFLPGILGIVCAVIWFVIWLLIALWAYKDAKSRGDEHAVIWFLVVFLLGLIGLIIYLVVGRKEKKQVPPPPPPYYQQPPPPPTQ